MLEDITNLKNMDDLNAYVTQYEGLVYFIVLFLLLLVLIFVVYFIWKINRLNKAFKSDGLKHLGKLDGNIRDLLDTKLKSSESSISAATQRLISDGLSGGVRDTLLSLAKDMDALTRHVDKIAGYQEQQGVHIHDRLASIGEMQAAFELFRGDWKEKNAEFSKTEAAHYSQLRDSLSVHLSNQAREDRALLQDNLTNSSQMIGEAVTRLTGEINAKLALLTGEVDGKLSSLGDKINKQFTDNIAETMESFHSFQNRMNDLIKSNEKVGALSRDVASVSRLILEKAEYSESARDLTNLLAAFLPDDAYRIGAEINGRGVAALLTLPGEEGAIAMDASLDFSALQALVDENADEEERREARARFGETLLAHINAVANDCIAPPQTGHTALMYIASEAAFAEIQAHHRQAVDAAMTQRVWLMSPTTIVAVLNMASRAIRDYRASRQLEEMQTAMQGLVAEAEVFESRLMEIGEHVNQAMRSVQQAESAGMKLFSQVRGITGKQSLPAAAPREE